MDENYNTYSKNRLQTKILDRNTKNNESRKRKKK